MCTVVLPAADLAETAQCLRALVRVPTTSPLERSAGSCRNHIYCVFKYDTGRAGAISQVQCGTVCRNQQVATAAMSSAIVCDQSLLRLMHHNLCRLIKTSPTCDDSVLVPANNSKSSGSLPIANASVVPPTISCSSKASPQDFRTSVAVADADSLTYYQFIEQYMAPNLPVLIKVRSNWQPLRLSYVHILIQTYHMATALFLPTTSYHDFWQ